MLFDKLYFKLFNELNFSKKKAKLTFGYLFKFFDYNFY